MRGWVSVWIAAALPACSIFIPLDDLKTDAPDAADGAVADVAVDAGACPQPDVGLEAYYRLDEGTGTLAADCSGHNRNGTILTPEASNGSWTPGKIGLGVRISSGAGTGCIEVSSFPSVTQSLTVAAWVRVDAYPGSGGYNFVAGKTIDANANGWRFGISGPNHDVAFAFGGIVDAGIYQLGSGGAIPLGAWHHIAGVFASGTTFAIFVDGSEVATKPNVPGALIDNSAPFRIGCRGDGVQGTYFDGAVDEVRIYSRALAQTEVAALAHP
jgi:hypothetical protein